MNPRIQLIKNSKATWYVIATVLFAGLIYFANLGKFLQALNQVNRLYLGLAILSGMSFFLVMGYIWFSFFKKIGIETNLLKSYKMFMAGNFLNSVTPLGQLGGEPFMAYIVSKSTDSSYEKSLSAVVSSDLINSIPFVTYTIACVIYLYFTSSISETIEGIIYLVAFLGVILSLTAYLLWSNDKRVNSTGQKILDFLEGKVLKEKYIKPLRAKVMEFKEAFEEAGEDKKHLVKVATISHIFPLTQFLSLYLILIGMGINTNPIAIYFIVVLSGLAMFSPTPGGSGTFEAAFSGIMILFYPDVALSTALATAVLFRLTTYWPGIPLGYLCLLNLRRNQ